MPAKAQAQRYYCPETQAGSPAEATDLGRRPMTAVRSSQDMAFAVARSLVGRRGEISGTRGSTGFVDQLQALTCEVSKGTYLTRADLVEGDECEGLSQHGRRKVLLC